MNINRNEGSISIFLCIILLSLIIASGILVDGARVRMAKAQADRAVHAAANSVLAGYHHDLKQEYGIFALYENKSDQLAEIFEHYLHKNLMTELGVLQQSRYLNLYDYRIEDIKITPIFNLTENEVTRNQIVEYMKYRAPKELLGGFLAAVKSFKLIGQQSDVMKKKIELDIKLMKIRSLQEEFTELIKEINQFKEQEIFKKKVDDYVQCAADCILLERKIDDIKQSIKITQEKLRAAKPGESEYLSERLSELIKEEQITARELKQSKQAIQTMEKDIPVYLAKHIKCIADAMDINDKMISQYQQTLLYIDSLKEAFKAKEGELVERFKIELEQAERELSIEKLKSTANILQRNKQCTEYILDIFNGITVSTIDEGKIKGNILDFIKKHIRYDEIMQHVARYSIVMFSIQNIKPVRNMEDDNPLEAAKERVESGNIIKSKQKINAEFPKEWLPSYHGVNNDYPNKIVTDDLLDENIDSLATHGEEDYELYTDDLPEQGANNILKDVKFGNGAFSSNVFSFISKLTGCIADDAKEIMDELYVNEYILGTFKNAVSESVDEKDWRWESKKNKQSFFNNGEVEYVLIGGSDEDWNLGMIKGQILLIRFTANMIHLYLDPTKSQHAFTVATSVAGWTGLGIPIVHTMIMSAWAMGESILDINTLLEGGKVPFYKTNSDWRLTPGGIKNAIIKEIANTTEEIIVETSERAAQKASDMVEQLIDSTTEKAFELLYTALEDGEGSHEDIVNHILDNISQETNNDKSSILYELRVAIIKALKDELQQFVGYNKEDFRLKIEHEKKRIKEKINHEIAHLKQRTIETIRQKAAQGIETFSEYMQTDMPQEAGANFMGSMMLFSYRDYLRLLLLLIHSETKMNRIEDLIQLNLSKKDSKFMFSDYHTYMRIEVKISMKYFFISHLAIPQRFKTPERDRHQISILIYEGYE